VKYWRNYPILALLVILQGTLLPTVIPWVTLTPAFVFLAILSLRLPRYQLLLCALWTGLVQDVLLGEMFGLYMLTHFLAMAVIWELKEELLDNAILTGGLRLMAASMLQDLVIAFVCYVRGRGDSGLVLLLQTNAGTNLFSNLVMYIVYLSWLSLRGKHRIENVLEAKK